MFLYKKDDYSKWFGLFYLMRINKPIGFYLLLWPTLWALWLSNRRIPDIDILIMFIIGVFLMRSLGCVINDCVDKDLDCYVERTNKRPLSCGVIRISEALVLFFILCVMLCILVIMLRFDLKTITLSLIALILTCMYPYTKRCMFFPQFFLGVTFGFSVLIVFSFFGISLCSTVLPWLLFLINILWTIIYDTEYAMIDRDDDIFFSINSSAVFLGHYERVFLGILQFLMLLLLIAIGLIVKLGIFFYIMLIGVGILFIWQQVLIVHSDKKKCFQAFLSNNYVGFLIFLGLILDLSIFYDK